MFSTRTESRTNQSLYRLRVVRSVAEAAQVCLICLRHYSNSYFANEKIAKPLNCILNVINKKLAYNIDLCRLCELRNNIISFYSSSKSEGEYHNRSSSSSCPWLFAWPFLYIRTRLSVWLLLYNIARPMCFNPSSMFQFYEIERNPKPHMYWNR